MPTYNIKVELPEASGPAALQPGAHRRHARGRRQRADARTRTRGPGGSPRSPNLKLEKSVEPLPADTKAVVQSVSAIGLKYLELEKGSSQHGRSRPGDTIPVSQTREPVNIDELFNMFDKTTRTAIKINTNNFGDGLAGRGLGPEQHDRTNCARSSPTRCRSCTTSPHPSTGPARAVRRRSTGPPRRRRRSPRRRPPTTSTSTPSSRPSRASPATWKQPPRRARRRCEQAIYSLPHEAPLIENATEFMHLLRPSAADAVHGRAAARRTPSPKAPSTSERRDRAELTRSPNPRRR